MFKRNYLAAGALLALGMSVAGTAQADALAQAAIAVTGLTFYAGSTNSTPLSYGATGASLSFLTFTDSTTLSANLNGNAATGPYTSTSTSGAGFGYQQYTAPGSASTSPFVQQPLSSQPNTATSASELSGTPIYLGNPAALGAAGTTASLASTNGNGTANSQTGLSLASTVEFQLAAASTISMGFDVATILQAWDSTAFSATATNQLIFTLKDNTTGAVLFSWAPNGDTGTGAAAGMTNTNLNVTTASCNVNNQASVGFPPAGSDQESCSGSYFATTAFTLNNTDFYAFSITQQSTANTNTVPEPSSIALAGLALIGLGFAGKRRKQ